VHTPQRISKGKNSGVSDRYLQTGVVYFFAQYFQPSCGKKININAAWKKAKGWQRHDKNCVAFLA